MHHVTLRCNNREFLFDPASFELFRELLAETRRRFPLSLFHYALLTNHVHLCLQVGLADTLSRAMHWLSTTFIGRFNRERGRVGHLWQGRFRSTLVEQETYFLRCMTYVDLNPVRAGLVTTPAEYPWSGHAALRAEDTEQLDLHPLYLELGPDPASRYRAYTALVAEDAARDALPLATRHCVGSRRFVGRMAKRFGLAEPGSRVEWQEHGRGIVSLCPKHGGPAEPN
jgi:putative transposase